MPMPQLNNFLFGLFISSFACRLERPASAMAYAEVAAGGDRFMMAADELVTVQSCMTPRIAFRPGFLCSQEGPHAATDYSIGDASVVALAHMFGLVHYFLKPAVYMEKDGPLGI